MGDSGAKIRLVVLLGLLGLVAIGFYRDRVAIPQSMNAKLDAIEELSNSEEANMSGVSRSQIQETMGMAPTNSFDDEEFGFFVEEYAFGRGIPFLPGGDKVTVVYDGDSYLKYQLNGTYDGSSVKRTEGVYLPPEEERKPLSFGGGGPPKQKPKDKDDDKEDKEEDKDEDKEETKEDGDSEESKDEGN